MNDHFAREAAIYSNTLRCLTLFLHKTKAIILIWICKYQFVFYKINIEIAKIISQSKKIYN